MPMVRYVYRRGLLALLVLTVTGNTRDSKCGTSNKISSHVLPQNYILILLIINMLQVCV